MRAMEPVARVHGLHGTVPLSDALDYATDVQPSHDGTLVFAGRMAHAEGRSLGWIGKFEPF